jgi:ATP-dependent Clp protease protease subunit
MTHPWQPQPGRPGWRPDEPRRPGWRPGWGPGRPGGPEPAPPTVLYLDPRREDLAEQLWRRRVVLLSGRLDLPAAEAAIGRILLADADGPEPIQLYVHCPDGDLAAAVVLTETLQLVRARVIALATGTVGGPVVGAYAAARVRRAHPHARFAFFEPRAAFHGSAGRLAADVDLRTGQLRFLQETIAAATGQDPDQVAADMQARRVLTAAEAADLGLVDEVVTGR